MSWPDGHGARTDARLGVPWPDGHGARTDTRLVMPWPDGHGARTDARLGVPWPGGHGARTNARLVMPWAVPYGCVTGGLNLRGEEIVGLVSSNSEKGALNAREPKRRNPSHPNRPRVEWTRVRIRERVTFGMNGCNELVVK